MTTVHSTELTFELPERADATISAAERRPGFPAAWFQILAIGAASVILGTAYGSSVDAKVEIIVVLALSWLSTVGRVERSLRSLRAAAGQAGPAVCKAVAGAAIASLLSFWLGLGASGQVAVLSMTPLAGAIILAVDVLKARSATRRVLLVGGDGSVRDLLRFLARDNKSQFAITGWVAGEGDGPVPGVTCLGFVHELGDIVATQRPDLVVVAANRGRPAIFRELANVAERGFRVVGMPEFCEHVFGRVPVRNVTDAWFMSILHLYQPSYSRVVKRLFDVGVASIGLVLTSPILPVIALLVRLSGGPVLYRQTRMGECGQPFSILKFRTMTVDAESNGAVWAQESDPRVTAIGRILRKTRLDELPQFVNVLRGEMSIVGPRPERPEFFEMLHERVPFWSRRHVLKPGITGWAQLRAEYAADVDATEEKLAYDLWYLRHQGLLVDLLICIRTIPLLFLAAGR